MAQQSALYTNGRNGIRPSELRDQEEFFVVEDGEVLLEASSLGLVSFVSEEVVAAGFSPFALLPSSLDLDSALGEDLRA